MPAQVAVKTLDQLLKGRGFQALGLALIDGELIEALIACFLLTVEAFCGAGCTDQNGFRPHLFGGFTAKTGLHGLIGHDI
ncbi:hypothetical protein C1893_28935 [Pseudomonas sp. MPR-ANC1]|nr:hypothetical protein C1893_28935 [Pseudomonas sp. MPR-ANC1]